MLFNNYLTCKNSDVSICLLRKHEFSQLIREIHSEAFQGNISIQLQKSRFSHGLLFSFLGNIKNA